MGPEEDLVLALDGSLRGWPLALLARGGRLLEYPGEPGLGLQEQLQRLLGTHRQELGRVLCCRGPGSYVGVRAALAAALGVARGLRLPLGLVGSLELVAAIFQPLPGPTLALADAGRGGSYGQLFEPAPSGEPGGQSPLGPARHLSREADWPPDWSGVAWLAGAPGEGRELPPGATVLVPRRGREEALADLSRGLGAVVGDYDLVSADYPQATGVR